MSLDKQGDASSAAKEAKSTTDLCDDLCCLQPVCVCSSLRNKKTQSRAVTLFAIDHQCVLLPDSLAAGGESLTDAEVITADHCRETGLERPNR